MKVLTTAAHSPFSNGICERQNAIITELVEKDCVEYPKINLDRKMAMVCKATNNPFNNPITDHVWLIITLSEQRSRRPPSIDLENYGGYITERINALLRTRELCIAA